jgi:hypothetical protein
MKLNLPIILTSILNGGAIRLTIVALFLAATVILTVAGCVRKERQYSLPLLYLAGIAFLVGVISGTASGLSFWTRMNAGETVQTNPVFEFLTGLLSYTVVSVMALIGSLITRISQPRGAR